MKKILLKILLVIVIALSITTSNIVCAATYKSNANPVSVDEFPKSYLILVKAEKFDTQFSNCTVWDRSNPSSEKIIYAGTVREQEKTQAKRKFCYNITPSTKVTRTFTHGAKYKGKTINYRITYYDFETMSNDDIVALKNFSTKNVIYTAGVVPSFGVFDENNANNLNDFPGYMLQYSQLIYSFKVKYEFYDDSNKPVNIDKGYILIGGHNMYEWTASVENVSNIYVSKTTMMTNTFTYDNKFNTSESYNKGMSKYSTWLTAGYNDWQNYQSYGGYVMYGIKDGVSNFTIAIGKDFEAYLTMETYPQTLTELPYTEVSPVQKVTKSLTINYLEKDTNKVLTTKYGPKAYEVGASYNVPSLETITDSNGKKYKIIDEKQKNITGTMSNNDVTVNVLYKGINTITTKVMNGEIDPEQIALDNENITINYKPKPGYSLTYIEIDGTKIPLDNNKDSYTFENVNKDHTIEVVYNEIISYNQNGQIVKPVKSNHTLLYIFIALIVLGVIGFIIYRLFKSKETSKDI